MDALQAARTPLAAALVPLSAAVVRKEFRLWLIERLLPLDGHWAARWGPLADGTPGMAVVLCLTQTPIHAWAPMTRAE